MTQSSIRNPQIAAEAADWAVILDAGPLTPAQNEALADWLLDSPRHVEELLLNAALFSDLGAVDPEKSTSIDTLLAQASPEIVSIAHRLNAEGKTPAGRTAGEDRAYTVAMQRRFRHIAAAAAMALFTTIIIIFLSFSPNADPSLADEKLAIATERGEQRTLVLEDGSIVHVNTQSALRIDYTPDERLVTLDSGEALFEVMEDKARPFRVVVGDTIVQAVGTTFNIYRRSGDADVAVIEGIVSVETAKGFHRGGDFNAGADEGAAAGQGANEGQILLTAGEAAEVRGKERSIHISTANVDAISSWRVRKLLFDSDRLGDIAAEFNRYNRTRIVISDQELADIEFSGVFDADDPQSLIAFLELSGNIAINRSKEKIELSYTN